jgi:capsular polysaccharide export protein
MSPTTPLLRSPFYNTTQIATSYSRLAWTPTSFAAKRNEDGSDDKDIASRIVSARVGGAFWRPALPLPRGTFDVVVLPPNVKVARNFWRQVLAGSVAFDLLAILPSGRAPGGAPGRGFEALAAEIIAAGAVTANAGDPHAVLDIARSVHAATSCDLAVLAELARRPVFYYQTGKPVAAIAGHAASWVTEGTVYRNPYTGAPASCVETVELLTDWRRIFTRNRNITTCAGMSMWKRRRIRQLLHTGQAAPPFSRTAGGAVRAIAAGGGAVATWSTRMPKGLVQATGSRNIALYHVEDGFIRGAGLGSNLALPASIIVDRRGVYFDPSRPSDLEYLIANTKFSDDLILRARHLITLLVAGGISKYAAGGPPPALKAKPGQSVILVPGQVADDLSVQLGACGPVRTNLALLTVVRAHNPEAFILYRPHPDVVAGHREGAIAEPTVARFADQVSNEGSIAALLERVDEVHTMTSLTGFEALLRGRKVETYGQPFYCNWGLTTDHVPLARRQRRISIEELVAATLILYPLYVDPQTGLPCSPEILISRLGQSELWQPGLLAHLTRVRGQIRHAWRDAWTGKETENA